MQEMYDSGKKLIDIKEKINKEFNTNDDIKYNTI